METRPLKTYELRRLIEDYTNLTGAQYILLDKIADLANPKKNYRCWPKMALLVRRTHYTQQRIRIAAKALEEKGFIKRTYRVVKGPDGTPQKQTRYYLNVPMLLALQAAHKADEELPPWDGPDDEDPFGVSEYASAPGGSEDENGSEDDDDGYTGFCQDYEDVVGVLQQMWPNHGEFQDIDAPGLRGWIEACIAKAGSPKHLGNVINWVYFSNSSARAEIGASANPGAYILKNLPDWLAQYEVSPSGRAGELTHGK